MAMYKMRPGVLNLRHPVMPHGYFTGDELLHITDKISIRDNYVYIGNYNTQINVKGEKGDSAYDSYCKYERQEGRVPLSEKDWINSIGQNIDWNALYEYAVHEYNYPHTKAEFFNNIENFVEVFNL